MNGVIGVRPPAWFWILSVFGLLFELMGVWTYLMQVEVLPRMAESGPERQLADAAPVWVTAAYALAVFAGLLGALGLLMRRRWARPLLILSLIACVAQFGWWILLSGALQAVGPQIAYVPVTIIAVAILLVWLAGKGVSRGWLR